MSKVPTDEQDDSQENVQIVQKPSTDSEPEVLSVEALMGDVHMPEVQAHTVDAAKSAKADQQTVQNAGSAPPVKGATDDLGRSFDPALHVGEGVLNKAGFLAKRRGGAGAKAATQSKVNTKAKEGKPAPAAIDLEPQILQTAQISTHLFLTLTQMAGGEEFKPVVDSKTGENEPEVIQAHFANYYRIKGIIDIPPGVALALGLSFYVVKRWNAPKFTERRQGWFGGIRRWWADFRFRRQLAKETKASKDVEMANGTNEALKPSAN